MVVVVGERTEEPRPGQQISRTTSTIPPPLVPSPTAARALPNAGGLARSRKPPPGGPPCLSPSPEAGFGGRGDFCPCSLFTTLGEGSEVTEKYHSRRKCVGEISSCY